MKNVPVQWKLITFANCNFHNDFEDPQFCGTLASDIYMHLREAEVILASVQM
jgi:hypothetical protein